MASPVIPIYTVMVWYSAVVFLQAASTPRRCFQVALLEVQDVGTWAGLAGEWGLWKGFIEGVC